MIPYEDLARVNEPFFDEYRRVFDETLRSGWYILGSRVERFEAEFARYCSTSHCIGVASGLDALTLSLRVFNFPLGSEVIVPSNTYVATVLAILQAGLKPVLAEPEPDTCTIDPERVEEAVNERTVGVMAVHLYGRLCRMDRLEELCRRRGLRLFEDCAQAHGATLHGRRAGSFGDAAAFSFYPTKNLGALGDGGAVTTADGSVAETVRKLRNYGSGRKYHNDLIGVNSRLDELQAAFLSVKLAALERINGHKAQLAGLYDEGLRDDFIKPPVEEGYRHVYHIYNIRHPRRDQLKEYLAANEIATEIHYPIPPHRQKALESLFQGQPFPLADEIHATTLSLPISFCHTEEDVRRVIETINRFPAR